MKLPYDDAIQTDVLVIGSAWEAWRRVEAAKRAVWSRCSHAPRTLRTATRTGRRRDYLSRESESPEQLVSTSSRLAQAQLSRGAALLSREGPRLVKEILIDEIQVPFDPSPSIRRTRPDFRGRAFPAAHYSLQRSDWICD